MGATTLEVQGMRAESPVRIWFHPAKFWSATKGLSQAEIDKLFDKVYQLACDKNFSELAKFDFITVSNYDSLCFAA
jgi:hypothetical protein